MKENNNEAFALWIGFLFFFAGLFFNLSSNILYDLFVKDNLIFELVTLIITGIIVAYLAYYLKKFWTPNFFK